MQALENCPQELKDSPQAEPQVESDNCSSDYDESFLDDLSDTDSCTQNRVVKIVIHLPFISSLANFLELLYECVQIKGVSLLEAVCMHTHVDVCVCSWN